ncbi:MAG: hypothetical protein JXA30_16930 [Deltaproteobacteria bacterium]|nr:hypothetical protein [Deltaproteobacteria bacterium]
MKSRKAIIPVVGELYRELNGLDRIAALLWAGFVRHGRHDCRLARGCAATLPTSWRIAGLGLKPLQTKKRASVYVPLACIDGILGR